MRLFDRLPRPAGIAIQHGQRLMDAGIVRVEAQGLGDRVAGLGDPALVVGGPELPPVGVAEPGMRARKARALAHGGLEERYRVVQAPGNVEALEEAPRLRVVGKGGGVRGDGLLQPAPLLRREVRSQDPGQVLRDPRLDAEPGGDGRVVGVAPGHGTVLRAHELHHETHAVSLPLHAAAHHQRRAHPPRDVPGGLRGVLLGEGGRARQHGDAGDLGQRGREHVRHPGPDVRSAFTVALQRKHRDHLRARDVGRRGA